MEDIDGDGRRDIVVFSGNRIYAINASGALVDNFPVTTSATVGYGVSPIIADIEGAHQQDIIAIGQNGLVYAYAPRGQMINGFPLSVGSSEGSTPAAIWGATIPTVIPSPGILTSLELFVPSASGVISGWNLYPQVSAQSPPAWPQYLHDAAGTGLENSVLAPVSTISTFLPSDRAYNWPNPVTKAQSYRTHIRFYLSADAAVTIKLFDLAGDLVDTITKNGVGGLDNEVEWDASRIQSGVYFAHIEAQGSTQKAVTVIKVAVIK
jgi:hypothetical protein